MPLLFLSVVVALGNQATRAAVVETNFESGATLSSGDIDAVVKLAHTCGIKEVTAVRTEGHLLGISILVTGDETIHGRTVLFKTLGAHREGWPGGRRTGSAAKSVGEFWSEGEPRSDERTIVRVGNRTLRVGLLNGIQPAGADKIIDAFVNGRIRYTSEPLKQRLSEMDFTQPSWLGIEDGKCWISFSSSPVTRILFRLDDKQVTVLDTVDFYE